MTFLSQFGKPVSFSDPAPKFLEGGVWRHEFDFDFVGFELVLMRSG